MGSAAASTPGACRWQCQPQKEVQKEHQAGDLQQHEGGRVTFTSGFDKFPAVPGNADVASGGLFDAKALQVTFKSTLPEPKTEPRAQGAKEGTKA